MPDRPAAPPTSVQAAALRGLLLGRKWRAATLFITSALGLTDSSLRLAELLPRAPRQAGPS